MKPDTNTVLELFDRDVQYQVPLYQRPYVWTMATQWSPLWDDIMTIVNHRATAEPLTHFLGAIVLDQMRTNPGEIPRYTVIDGQQRLTTLQIMLAAAARAMSDAGAEDDAALVRELVLNNSRKAKGVDRLKVWPTNADRTAFSMAINPDLSQGASRAPLERDLIDDAFDFFNGKIRAYLGEPVTGRRPSSLSPTDVENGVEIDDTAGDDTTPESVTYRSKRLRITLCEQLKLVSITLEGDDNAQVIFETLNARGTPLLALDLVKNVLFHQAARQGSDTDSLYQEIWQPQLDDDYWRENRRQGRLFRPAGELFLMHWLTMTLRRIIPATELFSTFRNSVLNSGSVDAASLIRELCNDAATMRSFDDLADRYTFFRRLPALDANVVLPVVLLLFRSTQITTDRRDRALEILESWMARRALTRLTSKDYNRQIPRLIDLMAVDLEHADDVLLAALSSNTSQISRWPTDKELSQFFTNTDAYGVVGRARLVMALAAAETTLYSRKTDVPTIPTELTVEHLMPQDWEEHWPLDTTNLDAEQNEAAHERRSVRIHRLGNLTLVSGGLNSAMKNAAWAAKRPELNKHSRLLLNARLDQYDIFDEAAIDERGAWLIDTMLKTWPGPESTAWTRTDRS